VCHTDATAGYGTSAFTQQLAHAHSSLVSFSLAPPPPPFPFPPPAAILPADAAPFDYLSSTDPATVNPPSARPGRDYAADNGSGGGGDGDGDDDDSAFEGGLNRPLRVGGPQLPPRRRPASAASNSMRSSGRLASSRTSVGRGRDGDGSVGEAGEEEEDQGDEGIGMEVRQQVAM